MKKAFVAATSVTGIIAGAIAPTATAAAKQKKTDEKKPNIVLIIGDDCRMRDLGCYGSPCSKTPNIDRLASEGLRFERFFQATGMSSPTRQCLLTGLYPARSGAYPNHTFIQPGIRTLPSYLQDCGYRVATQGKRHYAPKAQFPFEYLDPAKPELPQFDSKKTEKWVADVAKTGEPFMLYLCSNDPHSPWTRGDQSLFDPETIILPENLVDTPETRRQYCNYLAEVNMLDTQVGEIDAIIKKYGLEDNTVFIFTSEQGYSFPFAKWTLYDEGLQTGFIVRWPGVTTPGSTTDKMCEYCDVTPTLIDIAGGAPIEGLDGTSFKDILYGKGKGKKQVYGMHTTRGIINGSEYFGIRSVRDERFLYIRNLTPEMEFRCAACNDDFFKEWRRYSANDNYAAHQVERYTHRPAEELYDVVNDPLQQHNLAEDAKYAKTLCKMRKSLDAWMDRCGDKGQETEMEAFKHMSAKMGVK